jgi:hypothetical protein
METQILVRKVRLRFVDLGGSEKKETRAPVGLFFRLPDKDRNENVFVEYSQKTPGLPVILAWPDRMLPVRMDYTRLPLEKIDVDGNFKNEFSIDPVETVAVDFSSDSRPIDKILFKMLIAQDRFHEARRPIYRFSLPDAA